MALLIMVLKKFYFEHLASNHCLLFARGDITLWFMTPLLPTDDDDGDDDGDDDDDKDILFGSSTGSSSMETGTTYKLKIRFKLLNINCMSWSHILNCCK